MTSRTKRTLARSLTCITIGLFPLACGSSSGPDGSLPGGAGGQSVGTGTGGGSSSGQSGGNSSISVDGNVGTGSIGTSGPSEGGEVQLTAEQLTAIEDGACQGWTEEGENLPAILQLVVDVSLSMQTMAPGGGGSRWDVTRDALSLAIENLPASVSVGLLFYPNVEELEQGTTRQTPIPVEECIAVEELIPIAQLGEAASAQRTALSDAITAANVNGYTPTHDAYKYALQNSLMPFDAGGSTKFMLLITDGAPTQAADGCTFAAPPDGEPCPLGCGPNPPATACPVGCVAQGGAGIADVPTQPIIDEIAGAYAQGIRTFLIGSPGSEVGSDGQDKRPWLSQAAVSGGTQAEGCVPAGPNFCHLDMTQEEDFSTALSDGLAKVAGQVVNTCTFVVPDPPPGKTLDPDTTNLIAVWGDGTATAFLRDNVGACDVGWNFDPTGDTIELCAATCDRLKQGEGASVSLSFGCENVIK